MNQIHRLSEHKKSILSNTKLSISLILLIVILSSVIYYLYDLNQKYITQNNLYKTETENLKTNLSELNQKYIDVLNKIDITEKEKVLIISSLNGLASEYSGLMQNYDTKVNQVATLEKTLYIDDELLKKYSKYYFLNENYTPSSTEIINTSYTLNNKSIPILSNIRTKVENIVQDARNSNINIVIHSGYRSFEEQKGLKGNYVQTFGLTKSNQFSADQGYSEHQLGTAVDLSDGKTGLAVAFDKTETYKWMTDNAYRYGFILSYNKNNPYYQYEPWHWRYVGIALATYLKNNNLKFYDLDQKELDNYKVNLFD